MKTGMKHVMIMGALLIGSQAQASGIATPNGAGLQAGGPAVACMGANGHPDEGSRVMAEGICPVKGEGLPRPTPRYSAAS